MSLGNVFLFPGQGAQYLGMGKSLSDRLPAARSLFDRAREVLGFDLLELCTNGPTERLNSTDISQPAIFVASLAALEDLKSTQPETVSEAHSAAGLSLGEYTALVFAGVFGFEDGLGLVKIRGEAMQQAAVATPSTMSSILLLDREKLQAICQEVSSLHGPVSIANFLCPGNLVVSGLIPAVAAVEVAAQAAGAKTIRLAVAGAFHTDAMAPAVDRLKSHMAGMKFHPARIPVWSNVTGKPHDADPDNIPDLLARQVVEPVLWEDLMQGILAGGDKRFFEVGPGKVLAGLLKRIQRKAECLSVPA